ncbi:MAG: sigma-54 dependent transcriptional regulator [Parachlamydiales bacterium]|jgi:two-component system response regulator AtoC
MAIERILVVDDEAILRNFLSETLRRRHIEVHTAENGQKAINALRSNTYDMVITDMKMPDMTGLDVLKKAKEISPQTIVIVVTAYGSIENAVEAMRLGAFNYLIKPFSPDTIEALIDKASEHISLVEENHYLRQQVTGSTLSSNAPSIIYVSNIMHDIVENVNQIAKSNANVFITGESGTGKEVIAQAIHYNSKRAFHPFIKVNCAAIPDTLIESEFFGHEKGAFTGAYTGRKGRLELANTGTLLLDEITETPPMLQAKLLRVIQEQEFERVGGAKSISIDVRFIATTNRNIREAVANKILREDLYYRLNVVPIHLPPLRERKDDIIPLAEHFIAAMNREYGSSKTLSDSAKKKIMNYEFPGNIRELANIVERAFVLVDAAVIGPEHLLISGNLMETPLQKNETSDSINFPVGLSLRELEKHLIIETLTKFHSRRKAAEVLGISERTLRNRLQEYKNAGIEFTSQDQI